MRRRRPTLPLADWRMAVEIQNHPSTPAYGCRCQWCSLWREYVEILLPDDFREELRRVGINLVSPTDLYCNVQDEQSASIRVIFHAVGKMLSGPAPWRHTESGRALMYREIQSEPFVSILVYPQRLSATKAPALEHFRVEDLICIDLRITCPNEWVYLFESGRS